MRPKTARGWKGGGGGEWRCTARLGGQGGRCTHVPALGHLLLAAIHVFPDKRSVVSRGGEPRPHTIIRHGEVVGDRRRVVVAPILNVVREAALQERAARGAAHGLRRNVVQKVHALVADGGAQVGHDVEVRLLPVIVEV